MANGWGEGVPRQGPGCHRRASELTASLTTDQARHIRLRAQHLDAKYAIGVQETVAALCGIQAQDADAGSLAIRVRTDGLKAGHVEDARTAARSIVRTWAMRGTIHLVASEDAAWLLPLLGPEMIRKSRRRHRELGLTDDIGAKAVDAIQDLLGEHGPMSRAAIASRLALTGIPAKGQATYHLLRLAALKGVVCFGPDNGSEGTYDLISRWPTGGRRVDDPPAELARRHLDAYGPAGPEDLAAWSGLSLKTARAAFERIASELVEVTVNGSPSWILENRADWLDGPQAQALVVRLLPAFDAYLLGYRERDLGAPAEYARRIHPGGGIIRPALMVDGRALGVWTRNRTRRGIVVTVTTFEALPPALLPALENEAADVGRFLGTPAALNVINA